jgi:hypothetical protein
MGDYQIWFWLAVPSLILAIVAGWDAFRWDSVGEGFSFALMFVGIFGFIGFGVGYIAPTVDQADCHQSGQRMHVTTSYKALSGCFVETKTGHQIPFDNWVENTGN